MLRQIRNVAMGAAAALGVAVLALSAQVKEQDRKMDVRSTKGTMPGGVTLFGTDKVTEQKPGLEIATFGGG